MMKMDAVSQEKQEIRQKMLALRRALSDEESKKMGMALRDRIQAFSPYRRAKRIMAFLAMKGESNLDFLLEAALKEGKEVYVPVCLPGNMMEAGRLHDMEHFVKGPLGLRDLPKGYEVIEPEKLDLVLIPGVAATPDGVRLGMGAGYYDRYLSRVSFERRAAALWDFQVIPSLPEESFDQRVAYIVTEKRVIETKRG